jgi:DNA repair protein RecO (recombination protein O)
MPLFTTEGIIVKRSNFGEADRILTVLTPFKGKIKVIAKGVRRITSRRGGNVELLNRVRLHIFQGQGMPVLSEAQAEETFPKIKSDLILSSYASHLIELIDRLVPEDQMSPGVYELLGAVLSILETNPRQIFIRAFEVKLLSLMGFWSLEQVHAPEKIKDLLNSLQQDSWQEIGKMGVSSDQAMEVEKILRYYIEKILESSLKSVKILQQLKESKTRE